jgi:hypothetical protein
MDELGNRAEVRVTLHAPNPVYSTLLGGYIFFQQQFFINFGHKSLDPDPRSGSAIRKMMDPDPYPDPH